jgi:hypothetical protein
VLLPSNALISLYADKKGYHFLTLQVYIFRHFSLKEHFKTVLENFIKEYGFNPELFPESTTKDKPL